jgi:hypothetical protein
MENERGQTLSEGKKKPDSGCGKEEGKKKLLISTGERCHLLFSFPHRTCHPTPHFPFGLSPADPSSVTSLDVKNYL